MNFSTGTLKARREYDEILKVLTVKKTTVPSNSDFHTGEVTRLFWRGGGLQL